MIRKIFSRCLLSALCVCTLLCALAPAAAAAQPSDAIPYTEEELDYIGSCGKLRVGFVQDRIPVSFSNEKGELSGMSRYIFDRLSRLSGLEFEYVPLPAGSITYDYLMEQELDLVTSVEYNKENLNARGILISEPYLSSRKVVVVRPDLNFDPSLPLKVAVSTGSQTLKKVLNRIYPNFIPEDYASITDCFDALLDGRADLVIQNQYVVEYWISKPAYEKLRVIPVLGLSDELCFSAVFSFDGSAGPSEEQGRMLIGVLNKAIAALTEDEVGSYTIQAVMENQYTYNFADFISRYRYAVAIFSVSAVIIVALAVILVRLRIRSMADRSDARAKGEFLSAMSHEIRTPLNGLMGLNYLMGQHLDDRDQLERYVKQSTVTARYLRRLVSDMLDMSSIKDGTLKLSRGPMDLGLTVSTVAALLQGAMDGKGLEFRVMPDLPYLHVMGDEVRVQQVLFNLLENAQKFTPKGGRVTLSASQTTTPGGSVVTCFEVSDTGIGMSEEFQKHIFDSFAKESESVSSGDKGTGLGLPISRSLARLMGGDIDFTSKKGEGSTFRFTFTAMPIAQPEPEPEPEPAVQAEAKLPRILVAEDNDLNAEIIVELLEGEGYEVALARDGQEALEMFRDSQPGAYGVILMDLLMPRMDGYQATAAIRALPRDDAKTVRIIACTANSSHQERERVLSSGLDDFLSKPVDLDALLKKLAPPSEG